MVATCEYQPYDVTPHIRTLTGTLAINPASNVDTYPNLEIWNPTI